MVDLHPELARTLLDAAPGGLAFIDRSNRVVWANPAFAAMLGARRKSFIGADAAELPLPRRWLRQTPTAQVGVSVQGDLVVIHRQLIGSQFDGTVVMLLSRSHFFGAPDQALRGESSGNGLAPGVLAREVVWQRLVTEISRSRRYANPLSCLITRLDIPESDAAPGLQVLVRILKEQLRWVDVLGLWEPDRLLVVLPETSAEAASLLLLKLAQVVDENWPATLAGVPVCWGASSWRKGDDVRRLVRRAELQSLEPTDARQFSLPR